MINSLNKLMQFVSSADKPSDLLNIIKTKNLDLQYSVKCIRSFVIFCEENELLDFLAIHEYKDKIKNTIGVQIDTYVPQEYEIKELLQNTESLDNVIVKLFLETGCRATEFYEFVKTFDVTKFNEKEGVVAYPLFFRRHNKHSYYFFMSKITFDLIVENIIELKTYSLEYLKNKIRYHNYLALKYLRKYNFSLMVSCGVNFELANYIQGRSNKDVGFTHYLAKKELAIKEYAKVLPSLQKLSCEFKATGGENNYEEAY
ncbi:MAG: hypothetical protein KC589_07060 [Nanoarchaeota archaeon]|nr:hypothetical protein [Nanoarchaeota archaeon]